MFINEEEKKKNRVMCGLTQYHLYEDYCKECKENGIKPWMNEEEYIQDFNEMWACPEGYKEAYDRCLAWHEEVRLGFYN